MSDPFGKSSYGMSGLVAFFGTLTVNELLAIGGFALALATFAVNWWYKRKTRDDTVQYYEEKLDLERQRVVDDHESESD